MILIKKFKFVMILQKFLNLNDTFLPKKLSKTRKIQLNFSPQKAQAKCLKIQLNFHPKKPSKKCKIQLIKS